MLWVPRKTPLIALLLVLLFESSCTHLSPGSFASSTSHTPNVYLIRGFQDWYSTGIDTLAAELRSHHISTQTYREEQWEDLATALLEHRVSADQLILIGFSYGADDAILISRRLAEKNIPVTLLITIDPVTPDSISPNVRTCINYYQSNGFWDIFPWLRGVPVIGKTGATGIVTNINLRTHPDLLEPDTSHATIAANPNVHAAILRQVLRFVPRPGTHP